MPAGPRGCHTFPVSTGTAVVLLGTNIALALTGPRRQRYRSDCRRGPGRRDRSAAGAVVGPARSRPPSPAPRGAGGHRRRIRPDHPGSSRRRRTGHLRCASAARPPASAATVSQPSRRTGLAISGRRIPAAITSARRAALPDELRRISGPQGASTTQEYLRRRGSGGADDGRDAHPVSESMANRATRGETVRNAWRNEKSTTEALQRHSPAKLPR